MAKRTTGGRKPKTSRTKKTSAAKAKATDVVDSVANDVTDEVSSKLDNVAEIAADAANDVESAQTSSNTIDSKEADKLEAELTKIDEVSDPAGDATSTEEIVYTTPEAAAVEPVVVRKGGFVPMLLGGAVAAGLGFAASEMDLLGSGSSSDSNSTELTALTEQIESQSSLIAALEEKVSGLSDAGAEDPNAEAISSIIAEVESVAAEVETVTGSIGSVSETVTAIDTRLTTLEKAPIAESVSPAAIEAYERELSQLGESIAAQRAEVEQMLSEATTAEAKENEAYAAELAALTASIATQREEVDLMLSNAKAVEEEAVAAAKTAEVKLALSNVVSAIDAGDPFDAELAALGEAGGPDIPDALVAVAETGLPTLSALQDSFPALARQALASARAEAPAEEGSGGIGSFLQRSLGARSTTPREGDGPDAVLSRAEAALKDGDVETTLSEVEKLPEGSKTIMADWLAQAAARLEARSAADALAASLNTN